MKYIYPVLTSIALVALPVSAVHIKNYETVMVVWFFATLIIAICGLQTLLNIIKYRNDDTKMNVLALSFALPIFCFSLAVTGLLFPMLVSFDFSGLLSILWFIASGLTTLITCLGILLVMSLIRIVMAASK